MGIRMISHHLPRVSANVHGCRQQRLLANRPRDEMRCITFQCTRLGLCSYHIQLKKQSVFGSLSFLFQKLTMKLNNYQLPEVEVTLKQKRLKASLVALTILEAIEALREF